MIDYTALTATLAIELPLLLIMAGAYKLRRAQLVLVGLAINLLTQPVFAATLRHLSEGHEDRWFLLFVAGEIIVIFAEAALYRLLLGRCGVTPGKGLRLSFVTNMASLITGLLLPL